MATPAERMKAMRDRRKAAGSKDVLVILSPAALAIIEASRQEGETISRVVNRLIEEHGQGSKSVTSYGPPVVKVTDEERESFHKAYLGIGRSKGFVRIHKIKEALGWHDGRFWRVLEDLVHGYDVELHGGDLSELNKEELAGCYVDERGALYQALTWRE